MIQVEGLVKQYGSRRAVDGISFEVEKGEILGFLGPNGAGKTTTMRVLTCYLPANDGRVLVNGYDIANDSKQVRAQIGYLPENSPLYLDMTVEGYLVYMAKLNGLPKARIAERLVEVIERCGLVDRRREIIYKLSRGYRQRVGLARALIHQPPVLILDEPTASLDPNQIREVREHIKSLRGEHTVILSTHILPEVELVCDRVLMINEGRIVANDTPDNLRVMAAKGSVLELEVRGVQQEAVALAGRVAGVTKTVGGGPVPGYAGACRLRVEADREVREELARALVNGGFGLLRLDQARRSLEDVFVALTAGEEPAAAEAA